MARTGDMLVKLLLSSKGFDDGLKKSKKQVSEFEKAGQEMGKKLVTSFGQIAGAMMAIKGAGDAFKAVINSSQTIGDAFASTMSTAKTVTDNFIYALANADFSTFNNGLDDMISKAKEAYAAMDQLGNTKMSVDYLQATSGSKFKTAMAGARNKNLTEAERREYLAQAKQELANLKEGQETVARDAAKAIRTQLAAKTGLDEHLVTEYAVNNALLMDSRSTNVQERQQLQRDYEEYNNKIAGIIREAESRAVVTTTSSMGGTVTTKSKDYDKIMAAATATVEKLKVQNADMIVAYEILFRETDEGLNTLYATAKSAVAAQNQIAEWLTSTNEVESSLNNEANAVHAAAEKLRLANKELETERQRVYGGATFSTGIAPGTSPFGAPNSTADLPKTIAKLDENTLPATAFGSNEQTEEFTANIDTMIGGVNNLVDAYSALGSVIAGDNQETQAFIQATAQSAQAIINLIAQIVAETAARKASKAEAIGEAAAKTMSAHAGIPFAGIAAGIAAVASIVSTISSIPKFADGGIVTSATLGVFGEAGPEAVMPLDRLNEFVGEREVRVTGKIVGQGKDLSVIIDNYNKVRAVK